MQRYFSIDMTRGLIMMIMAIDHASGPWLSNVHLPEIVLKGIPDAVQFSHYHNLAHEISRVITHVCAPGFQLLAGIGLAISVCRSLAKGKSSWVVSLDMILRGVVLILIEFYVMRWPYGAGPYLFLVLCCIGSSIILFSVLRLLPTLIILLASLAVLAGAPLYAPESIVMPSGPDYLRLIWINVANDMTALPPPAFVIMYPILPWIGCFGLGWALGTWHERRSTTGGLPGSWLFVGGLILTCSGLALRWWGGFYGDRLPGGEGGPWTAAFWCLSKYPPSPAFTLTFVGIVILLWALLRPVDRLTALPGLLNIPNIFGRVALFFFVLHFFYFAITWKLCNHGEYMLTFIDRPAQLLQEPGFEMKVPLSLVYVLWLSGLALLWPLCWYYDQLRQRYRTILRYF